jgi:uncharacterized membrane protein YhhN
MDRIFAGVMIAGVLGLLVAEARQARRWMWVTKPVASVAFVAVALARGAWGSTFGQLVLAALVLSVLGDVLLIPRRKDTFLAGLVAFLLGHVAYCAAFVACGLDGAVAGMTAVAALAVSGGVGAWLLRRVEPKMKGPVVAYMAVLSTMVVLAAGARAAGAPLLLPVAAVMFYASDLAVALDRFVGHSFTNKLWGLPLYYGAQLLFALSL